MISDQGYAIAVTRGQYRLGVLSFALGYLGLALAVALIQPVGLRTLLALVAIGPLLWGTWIVLSARIPPSGLSAESLRTLRGRPEAGASDLRGVTERMLRQIHRLETLASRGEAIADADFVKELEDIERRLLDLAREARRITERAGVAELDPGESDVPM